MNTQTQTALLACEQLVAWIDVRRDDKDGEKWFQAQPTALQEAYETARLALRQSVQTGQLTTRCSGLATAAIDDRTLLAKAL